MSSRFSCFAGGEPELPPRTDRQPLQMFIGQVEWDDDAILDEIAAQVAREIGSANGILVIDPTSFPKKGRMSVGVERQWCGRYGPLEECFHRGKGECGLSDCQVRNWRGWHHHVTLSMLGMWFLTREVAHQKKAYR